MILRVGYEDHPMKVKVMVELKLGTLNISSHTWWTEIASLFSMKRKVEKFTGQDGNKF